MNELKVFGYNGAEVRTINKSGEMWWVLTDVCSVLNIKNATQAATRLDEDERSMFNIGRQGEAVIINESGLYNVILRSDKPEAKAFKRWVTHEVLPQIHKTGQYGTQPSSQPVVITPELMTPQQRAALIKIQKVKLANQALNSYCLDLMHRKSDLDIRGFARLVKEEVDTTIIHLAELTELLYADCALSKFENGQRKNNGV